MLTAAAGACIILVGPQVLTLLYSAQYRSARRPVLRVLVVEVVLAGATTVLSQAFMALGRPGVVTVLQLLGLPADSAAGASAGTALRHPWSGVRLAAVDHVPLDLCAGFVPAVPACAYAPPFCPRGEDFRLLAAMVQRRLGRKTLPA